MRDAVWRRRSLSQEAADVLRWLLLAMRREVWRPRHWMPWRWHVHGPLPIVLGQVLWLGLHVLLLLYPEQQVLDVRVGRRLAVGARERGRPHGRGQKVRGRGHGRGKTVGGLGSSHLVVEPHPHHVLQRPLELGLGNPRRGNAPRRLQRRCFGSGTGMVAFGWRTLLLLGLLGLLRLPLLLLALAQRHKLLAVWKPTSGLLLVNRGPHSHPPLQWSRLLRLLLLEPLILHHSTTEHARSNVPRVSIPSICHWPKRALAVVPLAAGCVSLFTFGGARTPLPRALLDAMADLAAPATPAVVGRLPVGQLP